MSKKHSSSYFRTYLASDAIVAPRSPESEAHRSDPRAAASPAPFRAAAGPSGVRPRSALRLRLEILEAVRDGGPSGSTRINCATKLSHVRFMRYLQELLSLGMLEEGRKGLRRSYALTARGLDFVNRVNEMQTLVAAFGLTI